MATNSDMPKVGVWRAVGHFKVGELIWPEGVLALLLGVGGAAAILKTTPIASRVALMNDLLVVAGAILAVVFTALAIVVSLPPGRYLRLLGETPEGGMQRFLDPFLVAVGNQVALILACVGYKVLAVHLPRWIEHGGFGLIGFLFVFGLLDVAALARSLVRHGVYRSYEAMDGPQQEPASVTKLTRGGEK